MLHSASFGVNEVSVTALWGTKANSLLIYNETPADYEENVDAMLIHHLERSRTESGLLLHSAQFKLSLSQNELFPVFQYRIIG